MIEDLERDQLELQSPISLEAAKVKIDAQALERAQLERREILAKSLAQHQKSSSIAQFFQKNKHLLGFENKQRSLPIFVRETIDNSLDACESAEIIPQVVLSITRLAKDTFQYRIVDNGPGIVDRNVGDVFCRFLFGSKLHTVQQKRGAQGLGISVCCLYAQATTGQPIEVFTRLPNEPTTRYYSMQIDVAKNRPKYLARKNLHHLATHGTEIRLKLKGTYIGAGRRSIPQYLKMVALLNPFLRITFTDPDGQMISIARRTDSFGALAKRTRPHIAGIQFGTFEKMLAVSPYPTLTELLNQEIYGINAYLLRNLVQTIGVDLETRPRMTTSYERHLLYTYLLGSNYAVPHEGVSLIGKEAFAPIRKQWEDTGHAAYTNYAVSTYGLISGSAFCVQGLLVYGGKQSSEAKVQLIRAVNKSPLMFQQGACAITRRVAMFKWGHYDRISHTVGELPSGPLTLVLHVAGGKMKYTSEEKAALADLPELRPLILEVLKKLGRGLATFQHKERSAKVLQEKFDIVTQMVPVIFRTCEKVRGHLLADHMPVISDVLDAPVYCERENRTVLFNASAVVKIVLRQDGTEQRLEPKSQKSFEASTWSSTLMNPLFKVTFDRAFAQSVLPAYVPWNQLPHVSMSILDKLQQIVVNVCHAVARGRAPAIHIRSRQSSNLIETPEGYWTLLDKLTARDMRKKRSALQVTRLLKMVQFFILQITSNKRSSLRETYYISESWGRAVKFDNQSDSDNVVEDIEVLTNFPRESFGIYAEERGHAFGALRLKHLTRNGLEQIDLRDAGGSGFSIPFDVNLIQPVSMEAKYIMCIEGSAMYRRLKDEDFHETAGCVLVSLTGQPPRSTRLFVKKIAEHFKVPVLLFIDCDGWSKMIAATMYMGAVKTAHMSEFLTTTFAKILGVSIHDVLNFDLPTDRLSKRDRTCLQLLLKNPRFSTDQLQAQIRLQLQRGVKSEQQAFAKYGLEFVVKVYLPIKLAQLSLWPHEVPQWTGPSEGEAGESVKVTF